MSSDYPKATTLNFEEFAIVDVTIALEEPLDVDGRNIWLDDEVRSPDPVQDFTIRLRGENEHSILARAFREATDLLDPRTAEQRGGTWVVYAVLRAAVRYVRSASAGTRRTERTLTLLSC